MSCTAYHFLHCANGMRTHCQNCWHQCGCSKIPSSCKITLCQSPLAYCNKLEIAAAGDSTAFVNVAHELFCVENMDWWNRIAESLCDFAIHCVLGYVGTIVSRICQWWNGESTDEFLDTILGRCRLLLWRKPLIAQDGKTGDVLGGLGELPGNHVQSGETDAFKEAEKSECMFFPRRAVWTVGTTISDSQWMWVFSTR